MEPWFDLFVSEILLIVGAVMIGTSLTCGKIMSGIPPLIGMILVFIAVFFRIHYESQIQR